MNFLAISLVYQISIINVMNQKIVKNIYKYYTQFVEMFTVHVLTL